MLVDDGAGDVFPEFAGFVGQLFFEGWDVLGDGVERVKINQEELLLQMGISIYTFQREISGVVPWLWQKARCRACSRPYLASFLLPYLGYPFRKRP